MGNNANDIFVSLLPLIVLFAVFYFLLIRPQRVQAKRHKEMLEGLKKGDKVVSSGGLICEIIKVEGLFFSVRLSDESTARLSRDFVAYKVDDTQPTQS
ncbi:preprotein translocase subunit YajC [Helicobacter canis]|uniref:Sec translocon accessory complex subunit YajC n=1 Tax=Helicobacter canis NCTC 12740 TaxID=1357399 RepID=V8CKC6_9HELI|nr:preprotein translocase subunit YajC [Helicobacter canis]ETD27532.1 preprotein translocase, YajC subunit [Helicobacter canis NCTC 12740]